MTLPAGISAQAHAYYDRDVASLERLHSNPDKYTPLQRVDIYQKHASSFFATDPDSAKAIYREMQQFGVQINDGFLIATALNSLAELYRMEGNYEITLPLYRDALQYLGAHPRTAYEVQGSLGTIFMLTNQLDSAAIYIDRSIALVREIKDTSGYAAAYLQRGVLFSRQKLYYSALNQFFKALDFSGYSDLALRKSNTYQLIAECYDHVRDTENAIRYASLALEVAKENGYKMMASEMHLKLGAYYQKQKDFELAESHYRQALPYQEEKGIAKALIAAYSNLGLMAVKGKDLAQARQYLDAASPLLSEDISDIHKSLYHTASGYLALHSGDLQASRQAFEHLLKIGNESGTESIRIEGYAGLLEVHRKLRNFGTALAYSDTLKALHTQIDLAFQNNTMLDLESKYESNIKNSEIAKLSALQEVQTLQLAQRHKHLMYTIIGLMLTLAALSAFWFAFVTKSRSNKHLEVKNAQLSEALANNKMLVKEIHHRVKNNLQVVSSLLNLQSRFETDNTVLRAINTGKYRVQSMSLLHQNLYLNEDLHSVTVKKYFEELAKYLVRGYPLNGKEVNLTLDIEDITLDVDTVVPMGLICNELITNSLKYAYPNTTNCELFVGLKEANGKIRLVVRDNGIGTPFTELPEKSTSMGIQLIKSFAHKLKATIEIDNFEGAEVKLTFDRTAHKTAISRMKNVAS